MKYLKYTLSFTGPFAIFLSLYFNGLGSYIALIYLFGLIPLLELVMKPDSRNMSKAEEELAKEDKVYDFLIYANLPIHYGLLFYYLHIIQSHDLEWFSIIGKTLSIGISCGALGINVAHELGHRNTWYEQLMSKALLLSTHYMHFFIEHNRGHHKNVSTDEDPASAKKGESIYLFWPRTIIFSYLSAWKLENSRIRKQGKQVISLHNDMVQFTIIQLTFMLLIFLVFGWKGLLAHGFASLIGILLLETVNYVEHYGLRRKLIKGEYYEKVLPHHSWNSDHVIGRMMLFELSRHSDHHYIANRKYQVLRHFDDSPQMPTGYPGMMLLSLIPPAWFWIMDKKVSEVENNFQNN